MNIVNADRIPGMMPAGCLGFFAEKVAECQSVVEVGCWRGRTTRVLYDNCPGVVYAVDTWQGMPELANEMQYMQAMTGDPEWVWHEFQHNMKDADPDRLKICRATSQEAARLFSALGQSFDMVIIDAAHDYDSVKADIRAWYPLISEGGFLCGDDYFHLPVKQAVDECFGPPPPSRDDTRLWGTVKAS